VDTVVPQYKIFLAWNFEVVYVRYLGRFNIICLAGSTAVACFSETVRYNDISAELPLLGTARSPTFKTYSESCFAFESGFIIFGNPHMGNLTNGSEHSPCARPESARGRSSR
jgi:hypothetical protein